MAQEKKRSAGFTAAQRLIDEMVANRTVATDYKKSSTTSANSTGSADDYVNRRLSQMGLNHSDVDDSYITVFLNDANRYINSLTGLRTRFGYKTSATLYESHKKEVDDLRSRSWNVRQYLEKNKTSIDAEEYDSLMSYLDDFDKATSQNNYSFYNAKKFYDKFETEDQYNFWDTHSTVEKRQKWYEDSQKRVENLKAELDSAADIDWTDTKQRQAYYQREKEIEAEIKEIEADMRNYERGNYNEDGQYYGSKVVDDYHDITKRPDFAATSANRTYDNLTREEIAQNDAMNDSSLWYFDANGVYRDAYGNELKVDESGNWVNPNAKGSVVDRLGMFMNSSEGERQEALGTPVTMEGTWESVIKDGEDGSWDQLTENEIAIYYYLLNSDGQQTADKYLSDMKTELNRRDTMAGKERLTAAFDEANALEKIALSVATVPAQLFSGAAGTIENTANTLMGNEINPYSAAHSGTHFSSTARGLQAAELDETGVAIPLINFSLGDAYQAGMSILDSYAAIGIGGQLGGALLATSAASSEATRLYEQGASMEQIAVGSAAAGAAEMVFESLSIDKLINMKDAKTVGQMIKNVLVQGGIEASEEGFTEIANILTNAIIMGSESDWAKLVEENGGDRWKAFLSEVQTVAHSAFSGFLSGMGSASVPSAVSYSGAQSQYRQTGKDIIAADGGVDALKALAMDVSGAGSKLTKQANKVTGETVAGEGFGKVTAAIKNRSNQKAVGKLNRSVETAVSTQNKADIAKSLEESGYSAKSAKNIADAIVANLDGEDLSNFQKATLESVKGNKKVQEIVDKLYSDIESPVSKRNLNLAKFALGVKLGVGIAPDDSGPSTAKAEAPARKYTVSDNGKLMNTETKEAIDHPVLGQAEDGTYKLVDENAGLVSSENVSYADHDQGIVVESFVKLSEDFGKVNKVIATMDLASRNKLLSLYNPATNPDGGMFVNGVLDAYFYGHRGVDLSVADKGSPINKLTEQQRQIAWETGRAAGEKATASEQSNVDTVYAEAKKVLEQTGKKKGTYHATLEAGISHFNLTPEQKVVYNVAEEIAQGIQTNIRVYDGTNTAQGFYNHETDEIMLNLNAANKGRDAIMAFTLAHEIVHRAKKGSPAKYQAFTEFLMKEYGKQGSDVEAMIQEQMDAADRFNKTVPKAKQIVMTEEKALEEVVCDACATMLLDTNAGQKLAEFGAQSKENRGFLEDLKRWISDLLERLRNYFKGIDPKSDAAREFAKFEENVKQTLANMYVEMATEAGEKLSTIKAAYGGLDSVLKKNAEAIAEDAIITDGAVVTDGERSYSIKSMKADIAEGKMFEDLKNVCGWTQRQVNELKQSLEDLVEYMTPFRDILDMNESYGREGRRFSPYKPNSDPLYKISMDFSTLCSKRLLTQYVIENLQLRENRPMSAEEQMAIRDMLNEYRKVEKGLQVACAMCYVEAARLKSPKQINKWLDDPATQMRNYFADKNPEFANYIKEKQADFKESRGYDRNATKKDMSPKDVRELNKIRPRLRSQYEVNAEEAKIIERAKSLPSSTYLTAGNLANLSETDPVIYSAYTAFVRTATRSKSLETDEPYYYGDSTRDNGNGIVVSDSFIEAVNRENGMRFSSWSDWRIQHLLDYITAVIDNSVRGAAMHGYTKFGDEVRVLGKTGMMFNMSGVAGTQTGLNEDGSLSFSPTESVDVNEAIQLRDEFPETAGLQCIGVSNDHIVALLRSDIIDYVIPYHVSGLNAGLRAMANIHGWDDFTSTQHAAIDKSIKLEDAVDKEHWREEPVFSEFFVGYDTGMTGIEAMRASADRYVQMCKDRGLKPKFEQFLGEENYWKLLIDRKMINQKTGKLIQQRAVTPTFEFSTIKEVVNRYVQNYDSGLESRALNHVVENWDSIPKRIRDLKKQGSKKANKASKAVDTLANQTLAAQPKGIEQGEKSYSLPKTDTDGKQLSAEQQEFFEDSKVRDEDGRLIPMYHGTNTANFTVFDPKMSDDHISLFFTSDPDVANTYTHLQDKGRDVDPYNLITNASTAEQFNKAQERVGGGLRVVKITHEWVQEMKKQAEKSSTRLLGVANKYADLLESMNESRIFNYDIDRIREVTGSGTRILKDSEISKLRSAMGSAKDHLFFVKDKRTREVSKIYIDTYKLFDEARNYAIAASTNKSEIGLYTYTETNSSVPFRMGDLYPGSEKDMVAKAIDRMKWVEEHHLGNRYKVYLNITNPYILDAGEDYSGVKKKVILEYDYRDAEWTVTLDDDTFTFDRDGFDDFALNAFDDKTYGEIQAQIQDDNDADSDGWDDDAYGRYVDHYIKLKNVSVNYVAPGNWNDLQDHDVSIYMGYDDGASLKTRDITRYAYDNGYDGVIFKNMKDAGGYAFMKGRGGSTVVTAFSSEQVKSVDNKKPTTDPDIRYSLPKVDVIEKPTDNKYIKMVEDGATHIGEYDVVPKSKEPKKTILAWKALVVKPGAKNNPKDKAYGNMYPPQVHQVASTPYGVWLYANEAPKKLDKDGNPVLTKYGRPKVKEGMTYRPAWHFGDAPYASQFRSTHGFFDDNGVRRFYMSESKGILVWALCEMAADENYQDEADMAGHIGENRYWDEQQASLWYLPENGYYKYMTNRVDPNSVTWYLSDKMRIVQTITDAEMRDILTWIKEDGSTDLEFNYPLRIDGKDVDPADYGIPVGNVVGDGIDYVDRWKNQFREIAMNGEIDITQSHFYYVPSSANNYGSYETVSFSKEVDDHSQELIKTKKDAKILFANSSSKSAPIKDFEAKTGVKVKDAKTIAGRKKIIEAAKNEGYDIVEFAKEANGLGSDVVIVNPDSVIRNYKFNNVSERHGRTDAVSYSLPKADSSTYQEPAYQEWDVQTALYDAMDHADKGDENLIRVGEMPRYITDKLGIEGDFYIYRNHAYENMVSRDQAVRDGRPVTRKGESIHFHGLGMEKMIDAVMALENPIMTISTKTPEGNPAIIMILPVNGKNNAPLYAVLSFYSNRPINGDLSKKPHIVLTIAEREFFGSKGRSGYAEIVGDAVKDGRVIDFNKEMRDALSVIANPAGVGNITDSSLADNLSRFLKEIKSFREKNHIDYKLPVGEDSSPRALLANAFEGIITNDIEKRKIQEYKGKVEMLNEEEKKLSELRAQIKELSFAKGKRDTKKIRELQFDANHTANRIATLDKTLLGLEASTPLQNILKREKEMAFKRGMEKSREKHKTARQQVIETREKRYAREKLQKLVIETAKWISYPSKTDVKCPDILKQPYADFLNGIDLSSKRLAGGGDPTKNDLRLTNAMGSLATALDRVMASQDPNQDTTAVLDTGYLDLPANFVQKLRDMTESVKAMMVEGEFVVNTMTASEVRQLSQMIRTLNHAIKEVSTLYANLRFANVEALGDSTMSFVDALGEIQKSSGMKDFVQWENALPYYAFKRFGEGGESIFEGLMDAQDKLAYLAQQIFGFSEKTWTGEEAKAWSEDTHTINLPDGDALTLTTADAMSIYCLSRREQGLKHLLGGGTRVMGIQKGSRKAQDSRSLLTVKDIDVIISSLTDRQRKVAEAIQEFMSTTCSDWGNEISMKRFLTKEFNEKFYFPIESNDENLPTKDPSAQQSDLFRLLNISATKPIDPRANNEVIIRNIFDVFSGHASDMARLNAYGMPLLDYMKWLNYREKTVNDEGQVKVRGVRKSMEKAYGNAAKSYVLNLIKDVNGRASDGGDPTILMKWMRTAKTASVGSSLRVATLQVTSYPRAALVLSPKNLALGLSKLPQIEKAKKYCGIALWKSFGFYDTNISRSIEEQMKGVKDVKQKLIELSLKGAEWGDAITWGCLWNACEYEVAATKKFKVGTEEFYQAVGKKLREVVYSTQVVDSTLTRSQIMRSKRGMAQEAAAFMSEPTLSANILMGAGFQFEAEKRRTGSAKAAWQKTSKIIGRAVAVYSIGQLAAALLEGLWDAWRDEDDEEFGEKYLSAFVENLALDLVPFNKIPIVSDVFEAALAMFNVGFYSSDKMSTTWLTQAVSAVDAWKDVLGGNSSTTTYNAVYKSLRAVSSFYGVAFSGVMREGVALWNNTAGAYDSTWKVRQYQLSKADLGNELYEAIIDGDTKQADSLKAQFEDQASMSSAIRKALRENDPRITEAAIAWNANDLDEYMRIAKEIIAEKHFVQDDVVMAIRTKANELAPDEGSTSTSKAKGLFTAEKFADAIAHGDQALANAIKVDIIQTAQKNGKTEEEAEKSFANTAKGDLKELFLAGSVSEDKAIAALTTYCGDTQEDAEERVESWVFEKENGFTYSDRGDAYKSGAISAQELKEILMSTGGKTSEEADLQIQVYDWEAQGYDGATVAAVREYNEYCVASDVPKDVYLSIRSFANNTENDVDANGKTIYYSAMKKIIAEIDAQYGLTAAQKTAIARSLGWAEKNIKKYKTW